MKTKKLPTGWKEVELGDVLDYEQPTDYIVSSEKYNDDYETPVLTAGKSFLLGYTNETEGIYKKLPVIIFDDFTTANKFVTFPFKVKSSAMKLLTPKMEKVDLKFIFWLMQTIKVDSTTHKRYYLSKYQHIKIALPPIAIQKKIVAFLEKTEKAKERRNKADELSKNLLKSIFLEMFGDPIVNNKKYPTKKVNEVCSLVRGSSPRPKGDPRYYGGKIPRLMIQDITRDGRIVTPKIDFLTSDGAKLSRPVKAGTVVMTVSGDVGVTAILAVDSCIHDGFVAFNELDGGVINTDYLEYFWRMIKITHVKRKVGAIFQNLTTTQIKNIDIPLAPIEQQRKFSRIIELNNLLLKQQEFSKEQLDTLFNALMQKAFKGELIT